MSTRSCVARKTEEGFRGIYCHWDGYPTGVGAGLCELYREKFKGDVPAMAKFLVDDCPDYWSSIAGGPESSPHAEGEQQIVTHEDAAESGCEFAYVFDGDSAKIQILGSYDPDGDKAVGWFGFGPENCNWRVLGEVDLTDAWDDQMVSLHEAESAA